MNSLLRLVTLALLISAVISARTQAANDKWLQTESLGKLKLGQKAAEVVALVGKTDSKGKDVEWEATGDWVQEWGYKSQGLTLNMASPKKGGAKTLLSITATAPFKLATARGIHIGSTVAAVTKAYAKVQDKEQSEPGKTFVAGSIYGGVIFTFSKGKVSQIFIGAAAE